MQHPKKSEKRTIGSIRPLVILGFVFTLWWLLPPFVKSGAKQAISELQAPFWSAYASLKDLDLYWSLRSESKDLLIRAIRDLARDNAALRLELQVYANKEADLKRLEELLNMPELPGFEYRVARVYRRDTSAWWDRMIIGLGRKEGIQEGMGVVCGQGVVGRIVEVLHSTATVELVSSPTFRMAAAFEGDPRPVTYQGETNPPFHLPLGEVTNVPTDLVASSWAPLRLVSTHLAGVFPSGLTLGWVRGLELESDGLFQYGKVHLSESLLNLAEVAVLVPHSLNEE